jgi:MFS family permease
MSADFVVGSLLPVFLLEYSGVDPQPVLKNADLKGNPSPLAIVPAGVVPVSLYQVTLLQTLPSLSNCVASYFLVPLSLAIGRRPVLILTAMCSWIGGFWAGYSTSIQSHLAARIIHGLGSATVEGLLPLIMQDMVFIHQRNRSIAAIMACQGPVMTIFGIISPYIALHYSWRWIYWVTSGAGILAWIMIILFVPETRTMRTKQELSASGAFAWYLCEEMLMFE